MFEMDYDRAAAYWTEKDAQAVHMEPAALKARIEAWIAANNTCALATASADGIRCTPIEYNYLDGIFYLFSEGGLKFRHLKVNKKVALAIFAPYQGFGAVKGLQVNGTAEMIEPFSEEYRKVMAWKKIPEAAMRRLPSPMNLIRITPESYDYLDSALKQEGFGNRQHLDL